jgi:hypothetical protein
VENIQSLAVYEAHSFSLLLTTLFAADGVCETIRWSTLFGSPSFPDAESLCTSDELRAKLLLAKAEHYLQRIDEGVRSGCPGGIQVALDLSLDNPSASLLSPTKLSVSPVPDSMMSPHHGPHGSTSSAVSSMAIAGNAEHKLMHAALEKLLQLLSFKHFLSNDIDRDSLVRIIAPLLRQVC